MNRKDLEIADQFTTAMHFLILTAQVNPNSSPDEVLQFFEETVLDSPNVSTVSAAYWNAYPSDSNRDDEIEWLYSEIKEHQEFQKKFWGFVEEMRNGT